MAFTIGGNIKKLRAEKGVTQEQLAEHLSITYQSVSKWENNVTSPDLYLIPVIADYFGVTIDELFQPNMQGYKNKAARLFAFYSHRRTKQNFDRADAEFEKLIAEGKPDADDYHNYGMLNQFRAQDLNQKAEEDLNKSIEMGNTNAEGQLSYLLVTLGRNQETIDRYEQAVKTDPKRLLNWYGLIHAYAESDPEKALQIAQTCLRKFPGDAGLLFKCGYICKKSGKFEEAEQYFNESIENNPKDASSYYNRALMYADLKQYEKAIWGWEQVIDKLGRMGFADEEVEMSREWPRKEISKLQELMKR